MIDRIIAALSLPFILSYLLIGTTITILGCVLKSLPYLVAGKFKKALAELKDW